MEVFLEEKKKFESESQFVDTMFFLMAADIMLNTYNIIY